MISRKYSIAILLLLSSTITLPGCINELFIENLSGWAITVTYTTTKDKKSPKEIPLRQGEEIKKIDCLETIEDISFMRRGQVYGTWASTISLTPYIRTLQNVMNQHPMQEAYIVIKGTTFGWDITPKWRQANRSTITLETDDDVTLNAIIQVHLDKDAQTKASAILNGNYSEGEKKGIPNLASALKREFSDITFQTLLRDQPITMTDPKTGKTTTSRAYTQEVLTPKALPPKEAKEIVDRIYRTYTSFKSKGYVR